MFWYFYRDTEPSASLSDPYIEATIKLQTSTSKSLPNTPKNEQVRVKRRRTRACSAVVNAKHCTKDDDFVGLDAYLERKRMEKHGAYLASENYSDDKTCDEESCFEYLTNVPNHVATRLHLSDDDYPNSSAFSVQKEGRSKLLSGQYQETFQFFTLLENEFVKLFVK